jgi:tetratricopeptide (TPR) repeat protein
MEVKYEEILQQYEKIYQETPGSLVFAPLAECYRKLGEPNKALSILREGIRENPGYLFGQLILASCYFDIEEFELAYKTLAPLVKENRENLKLQKLFAKICEKTHRRFEALETYKFLQFLDPRDHKYARMLDQMEKQLYPKSPALSPKAIDSDDWVEMELFEKTSSPEKQCLHFREKKLDLASKREKKLLKILQNFKQKAKKLASKNISYS